MPTYYTNVGPEAEFCLRPLAFLQGPSASGKPSSVHFLRPVLPKEAVYCRRRNPKIRRTPCTGAVHECNAAFCKVCNLDTEPKSRHREKFFFFFNNSESDCCGYALPVVIEENKISGLMQFRPLVVTQRSEFYSVVSL